jgi:hypothetical protein
VIAVGVALLLADLGVVLALRRRVPVERTTLHTLPLFIGGVVLVVLGIV